MSEPSERSRSTWLEAAVIVTLLCAGLVFAVHHFTGAEPSDAPNERLDLAPVDFTALKASTTHSTVKRAPRDTAPGRVPSNTVVHPRRLIAVYDAPAGAPFAKIRPKERGTGEVWLPVIDRDGPWLEVLLPSRPNGSTGWVVAAQVEQLRSSYLVRVHVGSRTLELIDDDEVVGSWPVAVGAPETPTPTGRTFVLGQFTDPGQSFSPVIIPLGTHSRTLDSYGGGPGTVALHGWNDPSVFGEAVSHGCIRVPADALAALRTVPLGTAVLIDDA